MEKSFRSAIRRYYEVELPRNLARRKHWPLLVALHGYEGNKDSMMRVARHIADGKMVVISLQGPFQFFRRFGRNPKNFRVGFGWGTTHKMEDSIQLHHRDLETIIQLAVRKYHADPQRIFLLAFSQACSLNYRYVFTHPRAIRGAVSVCGGVPGDWMRIRTTGPRPPTCCTSPPGRMNGTHGRRTWSSAGNWGSVPPHSTSVFTIRPTNFPASPFRTSGDGLRNTCDAKVPSARCQVPGDGFWSSPRYQHPVMRTELLTPDTSHLTPVLA